MMMLQLLLLGLSACVIAADEWVYPSNCKDENSCTYKATWTVEEEVVKFEIVAKQSELTWTGIGMAREKKIENSEFIWGYKGKQAYSVVIDGTYPDAYSPPTKDPDQHLENPLAYYKDGYLTVTFTHKRLSYEKYEFNFTDSDCYYFIFPIGGGKFLNDDGLIGGPDTTPLFSAEPICLLGPTTPKPKEIEPGYKRICYYTNWSQHRLGNAKFLPGDIASSLCTHVVFAYANISSDNTLIPTEPNDDTDGGLYEQFNGLKKTNLDLVTMLAVGGWEYGTGYLSQMLLTVDTRKAFIASAIAVLRKYDFDGLNIDLQCLGAVGSPPEDKTHFTSLIEEMRAAFNSEVIPVRKTTLILSLSIPALADVMDNGYEVEKIHMHLDFINLKTDDLILESSTVVLHHTALYPGPGINAVDVMKNLVAISNKLALMGAPRGKTNIGVATYGRGFILKDPNSYDIGAPVSGPSPPGECTKEWGIRAYYEICPLFKDTLAKKILLPDQKVPYIVKQDLWMGYDDVDSLKIKVNWLKDCGHGGYVVSTVDMDDFKGQYCNQGPYPLMHILSETLLASDSSTTEHPMSTPTVHDIV